MVKFRMLFTIPKDIVDMGVQKDCHIQWQDKTLDWYLLIYIKTI